MMPASVTITKLQSATFHTAAVPLPDMEQPLEEPAVVMEPSCEYFPMPIITEVVSLAGRAHRFGFAETSVPLPSSDDIRCSEQQANEPQAVAVADDIKPFGLPCTSNDGDTTSLEHRTDHAETSPRLSTCGVKIKNAHYANENTASASVGKGSSSLQQTNVKSRRGLAADKSAVSSAVINGFEPRVLKNSTDRKYERRPSGNSAASTTSQFILVPVSVNRMPVPLNPPQACTNQMPASAKSVPNETLVNYTMQPSGHSNPTLLLLSPVTGAMAPNIQSGQPSLPPTAPSQAPLIAGGIRPSAPPQVALMTAPQSTKQQSAPGQAPLITQEIRPSALPKVPLITVPSTTATQSTQQPSVPVQALLFTREIRQGASLEAPLATAPITTVSQYLGAKCQVTSVPHVNAKSTSPDKPHMLQAPSGSHVKQSGAISGSGVQVSASCQTSNNQQPKERVEKSQQAKGPLENSTLSKVNNSDGKQKSHLSSVPDCARETASQIPGTPNMCPTQVWQRAKPGEGPSKQPQNGHALQMQLRRSSVLNSPWKRIIVTSDVEATLALEEVRKGIEAFLMVNGVPKNVSKGGVICLHWNGKDLGTFKFKHGTTDSSLPARQITTEDTIVISSDDEQAEEAQKATLRTIPVTSKNQQAKETEEDASHTTPEAAASVKSACRYRELLEPEIVLEESEAQLYVKPSERSSSDSEDSSSDSEKVSETSHDDPTYDPYAELDDISSEDELPVFSSSEESDDATAKSKNHDELSGKSCAQAQEHFKKIPAAGESSLTRPCSNNSSKARKRKCSGSSTADALESSSDENSPAEELERKNDNPLLSHTGRFSQKVRRRSSRPVTRLASAKAKPPVHVLLRPCHVELFPIDMTLVVNGSVNLSVVQEEELFITDHSGQGSLELNWARLANAISQTPGLVGDW